jgi:cytochrome bd-type quinol oxidase subunit 2
MKRFILNLAMVLAVALMPAAVLAGNAAAACVSGQPTTSKDQVLTGIDQTGSTDCSGSGVTDFVDTLVSTLSLIVGIAAIIMIIASGYKYITSGGEASKVANAKNTLIYALIGVVIAVLAQLLVRFVITQANTAANACPAGQHHTSTTDPTCIQ